MKVRINGVKNNYEVTIPASNDQGFAVLYEGTLSDCQAFIWLSINNYI